MKKLLTMALCLFISIAAFSQSESAEQHMTFMGIPIDGTIDEFTKRLNEKRQFAIDYNYSHTNVRVLKGFFGGTDNCRTSILHKPVKGEDLVYSVSVDFPEYDNWDLLESSYLFVKEMLINKYGSTNDCTESFVTDKKDLTNDEKMILLKENKCNYKTTFIFPSLGMITLYIRHFNPLPNYDRYFVSLFYYEYLNSQKVKSEI